MFTPKDPVPATHKAAHSTVGTLFRARASMQPQSVAVQHFGGELTYAELNLRVNRTANMLLSFGVSAGDRVAVLSENRVEYLELQLAVAKLGVIIACQNWRLAPDELSYCIGLVEPKIVFVSPENAKRIDGVDCGRARIIVFDAAYQAGVERADSGEPLFDIHPEQGLFILYTSGTTGRPKGAVISHRAEIARCLLKSAEFNIPRHRSSATWMPFFHMAGTEDAMGVLLTGGKAIILNGFDPAELATIVADEQIGWLRLMPGMIAPFISELRSRNIVVKGVDVCGTMADLVPPKQIAEITSLLSAPFVNSFGSTETGIAPASSGLIPVGVLPSDLGKTQTSYCEVRLVGEDDQDVPDGEPGEAIVRGPTLFSGYWNADEANAEDFRGGWFHMGDVFRRREDRKLDYLDRVKYMIKSGGENIYPAEIERVLLQDSRVAEAVVVKAKHEKWGEVPVAFVARREETLSEADLEAMCTQKLARFKKPNRYIFIKESDFPRNTTGKIVRLKLETLIDSAK
jgi:acyl-CoA synthetase (AMP-forming)/AMP-acid ligase II